MFRSCRVALSSLISERATLASMHSGPMALTRRAADARLHGAAEQRDRRVAARPASKLDFDSVGWGAVRTLLDWKLSPQQIAATLKRRFSTNLSATSRTRLSTRPSTRGRGVSCASNWWPACATVAATACPDREGSCPPRARIDTWTLHHRCLRALLMQLATWSLKTDFLGVRVAGSASA